MKIYLRKLGATTLGVQDDAGAEFLAGLKMGEVVSCEATKPRNYRFLRKYFALLNLAFDYWEPPEGQYKGQTIEKEFERFRKDVQIMAGYGRPVWNINSEIRHGKSVDQLRQDETRDVRQAIQRRADRPDAQGTSGKGLRRGHSE